VSRESKLFETNEAAEIVKQVVDEYATKEFDEIP
jgi:hypothetical protein